MNFKQGVAGVDTVWTFPYTFNFQCEINVVLGVPTADPHTCAFSALLTDMSIST